ncbi:MAG: methyltransferase domain-containing protein [Pseudomonadota bacterium]|nr:MAG: methyltransferase domain-containing protein [Pseudomonadota bacterium]
MEQPEYAYRVFTKHFERSGVGAERNEFTVLELGPGDSLFAALIAYARGARECYLVDTGSYARDSVKSYHQMVQYLEAMGLKTPAKTSLKTVGSILSACNAHYLTAGLASLRRIPDGSVDFVWSHAVLEHVRLSEFDVVMQELKRILKETGICSHRVDLTDHLGGALNNLRFSQAVWESDFMAKSGFYTNRIRFGEILERFRAAGYAVEVTDVDRWEQVPIARKNLASDFARFADDDLRILGFDVLLRPLKHNDLVTADSSLAVKNAETQCR